jgi:glycosyltransferase involved in cell wall biosynthesis
MELRNPPSLAIVVPCFNEEEVFFKTLKELETVVHNLKEKLKVTNSSKIYFIDDGSSDNSWEEIEKLHLSHSTTYGIRFSKNFGKSQALHAGFAQASGDVVVTLDADLQDAPSEIPNLYKRIIAEDLDLISGWKKKRYDSLFFKNIPSKLFNWAARRSSGIYLHDFNCGIKAYKKEVIKSIEVFGEMHRYIPVLAAQAGFNKIGEQIVVHQARKFGVTKFGIFLCWLHSRHNQILHLQEQA